MNTTAPRSNRHGSAVITLPSDTEILITRAFDAPAALIFDAVHKPEHVKQWWGFGTSEWKICDIDFRVGGEWRYKIVDSDMEVEFYGEYKEIERPRRVVSTEVFAPFPDAGTLNTMTLDEVDSVTTMTVLIQAASKETRDAQIESGMETGMQVSYNRLEDLVRNVN
jgi:uncharacterized protein YndB with AHSA1/START domain